MEILDSGTRREFDSGAVRDVTDGKGRCDLLPLDVVAFIVNDSTLSLIDWYVRTGDDRYLCDVITKFSETYFDNIETAVLEVAKHYEDGAKKYDERNWEKGIPLHCYIDSGVRHYLKFHRGDKDEPHDRAFLWNMLGAIWTQSHKPDLIDLPFNDKACPHRKWFGDMALHYCGKDGEQCDDPAICTKR